ncbi:hypothetical protein H5410_046786 [Solanum commersonii]|uniref:Uncharacterized protein n=1 Tax=Solanum commersonii TaxID=4109 RepID=A0A9J5XHD5_SOLCO|nr:hypothetical protein H5410_046786 [Solanum commersonii]
MPSKSFQSPYLTEFGSSEKEKQKFEEDVRPISPFDGCDISYQPLSNLLKEYQRERERKLKDDKYRAKSSSFGFEHMDFVVAFLRDKNWLYSISQPKKCRIDEISKICNPNQYKFTTVNCLFKTFINNAHTRYYCSPPDDN